MDHSLFLAINGLVGKNHLLDVIGKFLGGDYFLVLMTLLVVLLWLIKPLRNRVYLALGSALISRGILTQVFKMLMHRPRPFETLSVHQLIIDNDRGNSFPSGHATVYFALAFAFWGTEYFWPLFILAVIGALARVFVGVHYPSDILGGAIIGAATSIILYRLFKRRILR